MADVKVMHGKLRAKSCALKVAGGKLRAGTLALQKRCTLKTWALGKLRAKPVAYNKVACGKVAHWEAAGHKNPALKVARGESCMLQTC